MGILDKSTRVLDIVLTDYGREQHSKGELEFSYYAFSDDGVDYDPYIANSGSITDVQLLEEQIKQVEATLVREAVFGHQGGKNLDHRDKTNIKNLLFTVPQGQLIVPEMLMSPDITTGSIEAKQQKVVERSVTKDSEGDAINVIAESDRGYRKFKSQKLLVDLEMDNFFDKASRDGYIIRVFESGSFGLSEIKHKRDKSYTMSFSNDIQMYSDGDVDKVSMQPKEDVKKIVK